MSITDELREYALGWDEGNRVRRDLTAIADRIDEEHEREVTMARGEAVTELGHKVVSEYVKLPKDADGEYIHVGDVLTDGKYTFVAYELAVFGDGSWSIRNEDGNAWAACDVTHHHEPTVEDVLREMSTKLRQAWIGPETFDHNAIIAEYAAKLRLAKEDA